MKNYKAIIAAVVAGLGCTAATSFGALTSISPGTSGVSLGAGTYSESGGTLLTTLVSGPITLGSDTDKLTTQVYSGDANNTLGGLTFVYTLVCSAGDVTGLTVDGFVGTVQVGNYSGTGALATTVNYGTSAGNINFAWSGQSAPVTLIVVVDTSTTTYAQNAANVQDGSGVNLTDLAPVPEPATIAAGALMLLPLGIGAVRSLRKERAV